MAIDLHPPPAILLIDAGNTRIKLGWIQPRTTLREADNKAIAHTEIPLLAQWLDSLPVQVVGAKGVNVASQAVAQQLDSLLEQRYGFSVQWCASQQQAAGVSNSYTVPSQLGPDRWMAMIGLTRYQDLSRQPMLLASFGTATTLDTLIPRPEDGTDQQWLFAGGLILPGVELMRTSLATGTAKLPSAQGDAVAFPNNTQLAISSGIAAAQAGALQRQWLAALQTFGQAPRVFSTGGAWPQLQDEIQSLMACTQAAHGLEQCPVQWLAAPVLDGLAQLALNDH